MFFLYHSSENLMTLYIGYLPVINSLKSARKRQMYNKERSRNACFLVFSFLDFRAASISSRALRYFSSLIDLLPLSLAFPCESQPVALSFLHLVFRSMAS